MFDNDRKKGAESESASCSLILEKFYPASAILITCVAKLEHDNMLRLKKNDDS
jgi:hypothetical protein